MTVSVTGATGFIGRRLVHRLRSGTLLLLRVMTFLTQAFEFLKWGLFFTHYADNHSIRVLTRSKSKAELIFPGKKKVINYSARIINAVCM